MRSPTQQLGHLAEQEACSFLENHGLNLLTANYSCSGGEIDLIMQDGDYRVFVEVRYRKNSRLGSGIESVTKSKQQKIIRAAKHYLISNNLYDKIKCRFDVIASWPNDKQKIQWVKDAFRVN